MIKTLLINKIDLNLDEEHKMFFLIGNIKEKKEDILDFLNDKNSKYYLKSLLMHNGITIKLNTKDIPDLINELIEIGCRIYGVYELYEPI